MADGGAEGGAGGEEGEKAEDGERKESPDGGMEQLEDPADKMSDAIPPKDDDGKEEDDGHDGSHAEEQPGAAGEEEEPMEEKPEGEEEPMEEAEQAEGEKEVGNYPQNNSEAEGEAPKAKAKGAPKTKAKTKAKAKSKAKVKAKKGASKLRTKVQPKGKKEPEPPPPVKDSPPRGPPAGRGRGLTLPSWMTKGVQEAPPPSLPAPEKLAEEREKERAEKAAQPHVLDSIFEERKSDDVIGSFRRGRRDRSRSRGRRDRSRSRDHGRSRSRGKGRSRSRGKGHRRGKGKGRRRRDDRDDWDDWDKDDRWKDRDRDDRWKDRDWSDRKWSQEEWDSWKQGTWNSRKDDWNNQAGESATASQAWSPDANPGSGASGSMQPGMGTSIVSGLLQGCLAQTASQLQGAAWQGRPGFPGMTGPRGGCMTMPMLTRPGAGGMPGMPSMPNFGGCMPNLSDAGVPRMPGLRGCMPGMPDATGVLGGLNPRGCLPGMSGPGGLGMQDASAEGPASPPFRPPQPKGQGLTPRLMRPTVVAPQLIAPPAKAQAAPLGGAAALGAQPTPRIRGSLTTAPLPAPLPAPGEGDSGAVAAGSPPAPDGGTITPRAKVVAKRWQKKAD